MKICKPSQLTMDDGKSKIPKCSVIRHTFFNATFSSDVYFIKSFSVSVAETKLFPRLIQFEKKNRKILKLMIKLVGLNLNSMLTVFFLIN